MAVWYNRVCEVGQTIAGRASVMRKVRAPPGRRPANGLAGGPAGKRRRKEDSRCSRKRVREKLKR